MDAITEVEKLTAAQQLTMTFIPSSKVDMMSNGEDQSFQCQGLRHIIHHCPHISCHECDELEHMVMDCPHRISTSETLAWHHKVHRNCYKRSNSGKTEKEETGPDHSLDTANIITPAIMTCTEATTNHNNGSGHQGHSHRSQCDTPHQSHCKSSTHHNSSGHHSQDHSRLHSQPPYQLLKYTSHQKGSHSLGSYSSQRSQKSHQRRNMKVQIEEPSSDFYSSDDHSTDSGEDSES